MRVTIRLYKRYDYDLIALRLTKSIPLNALFKQTLIAYIKGECFSIKIPQNLASNIPDDLPPQRVDFILSESNEYEKKAIKLLNSIREKKRNDFLKTLLRGYLSGPIVTPFIEPKVFDQLIDFVEQNESTFNSSSSKIEIVRRKETNKQLTMDDVRKNLDKALNGENLEEEVDDNNVFEQKGTEPKRKRGRKPMSIFNMGDVNDISKGESKRNDESDLLETNLQNINLTEDIIKAIMSRQLTPEQVFTPTQNIKQEVVDSLPQKEQSKTITNTNKENIDTNDNLETVNKEETTTKKEEQNKSTRKKIIIDTAGVSTQTSTNQSSTNEQNLENEDDFDWLSAIDSMMDNF